MIKIECKNYLCIYQENNLCILDEVSINASGQCNECIHINPDWQLLDQIKRDKRKKLDKEFSLLGSNG